jgi:hypothetical protein
MNKTWDSVEKDTVSDKNQNSFELERVYFDVSKKLNDNWSVRATLDVMPKEETASATDTTDVVGTEYETEGHRHEPKNTSYEAFLKFAYAEGNYTLTDGVTMTLRAGMIDSPITGYLDKLSDSRWIQNNMILQYKKMLPGGHRIDNSADLGATFDLNAAMSGMSMMLTGGVVNGEGFKNVQEDDNDGKAYYGRFVFKPAEMIQLFTFGRYEIQKDLETENSNWKDDFEYMYGGGAALVLDIVKVGGCYTRPVKQTAGDFVINSDGNRQQLIFSISGCIQFFICGIPVLMYQRCG